MTILVFFFRLVIKTPHLYTINCIFKEYHNILSFTQNFYEYIKKGATQTIKPSYSLKGSRFSKNPTYCSKIVYQAYYYGSGNIAYVYPISGTLSPYDLRGGVFQRKYKPSKVATFK